MIQRSLFNEIQGVGAARKADALEGNLFKICSGGSRITDTDLSIAGIAPLRLRSRKSDKHKRGYHLRNI